MAGNGRTTKSKRGGFTMLLPKPLRKYLGFAFLNCWTSVLLTSSVVLHHSLFEGTQLVGHLYIVAFYSAIALVVAIASNRLAPLGPRRRGSLSFGALGCVGFALVVLAIRVFESPALLVAGYFLTTCTLVWLTLCWQEAYALHGARSATLLLAITSFLGTLLFFALSPLPENAMIAAGVLLPLLGALLIPRDARRFAPKTNPLPPATLLKTAPYKLLSIVALISFAAGAMRTSGEFQVLTFTNAIEWLGFGSCSAIATLFGCYAVSRFRKKGIELVFYASIPLVSLGCAALGLLRGEGSMIGLTAVTMGSVAVRIAAWVLLLDKALVSKTAPLGMFALLIAFENVGALFGQTLSVAAQLPSNTLVYLCLLATTAAALMLSLARERFSISEKALVGQPVNLLEMKIDRLSDRSKLSPREREILHLWATGRKSSYIENALSISHNTAKTHIKHIYEKAGVSSKEELLNLLEEC